MIVQLWRYTSLLNKSLELQYPPCAGGRDDRKEYCYPEADGIAFHSVNEVHTEDTCYECREHENDADRCKRTHHCVHIVVDDARVSVHG